jgi:iron-sulfur cluster repair protein YtfE (RIC family)
MPIAAEQTVADVSKRPGALEVLQRLGINHCCGAHLSLREAAAAAGVPLDQLLRALDEAPSAVA